uniref:Ephrin type-A receptor 2-like n=1 Tax=Diabrotica virgifera virgifera TaxID=50390 RepID=A0A6P7F9S2_DIAVI
MNNPFLLYDFLQHMFRDQMFLQNRNTYSTDSTDTTDSTVDFEPMVPQKKEYESKMTDLELVEKTVSRMKRDKDFLLILQNILNVCNDSEKFEEVNLGVLRGFAQLLDEISDDNCEKPLKLISTTLSERFLTKELLKFTCTTNKVTKLACLATGGFGRIFIGTLEKTDGSKNKVIIKKSLPGKEKFLKSEATILSQLDHKNIIKMVSFVPDSMELVMEFMEKGRLDQFLEGEKVPKKRFYNIILDIITGMEYLEQNKIIHRDLASRNIFVGLNMECKIGDFGLAVKVTRPDGIYKEQDGGISGYHTPPSVIISQEYSIKSDIWAFGLLVWEMHFIKYGGFLFMLKPILDRFRFSGELPYDTVAPRIRNYVLRMMHEDSSRRPPWAEIKKFFSSSV